MPRTISHDVYFGHFYLWGLKGALWFSTLSFYALFWSESRHKAHFLINFRDYKTNEKSWRELEKPIKKSKIGLLGRSHETGLSQACLKMFQYPSVFAGQVILSNGFLKKAFPSSKQNPELRFLEITGTE